MKSNMIWACLSVIFCVFSGNLLSDVSAPEDVNGVAPASAAFLYDLPEEVISQRDDLMSKADRQIRTGLLTQFVEKYPWIKKARDFETTISENSEKGRISIFFRHTHLGKAKTTDESVPEGKQFSVLVILQEPPNNSAMGMGPIYPYLGLIGQIHAMAGDPELEAALKRLVDALKPLAELNDSYDAKLSKHIKDKQDSLVSVSLNDLPEDTLIARVLEQKIYLKDINPSQAEAEKYGKDKTPEQLEQWQKQNRISALSNYFRLLFERYVQQKNIQVTETEIEQLNKSMQRNIVLQNEKHQKKLDSLQKELQADNLDEKKRTELAGQLELYTRLVKNTAGSEELFKIRNTPAEQVIRQWKITNGLYKQYGGRVIFQQAGPEPLDAYRKFFEEEQNKGNFEFYNKEAEGLFWEYYRNEKMHTFYSDEAKAKAMMETPWWLHEPEEAPGGDDADLWGDEVDGLCNKETHL